MWYLDHEGMDSTLIYMVERVRVGGSEMSIDKVFILDHQRMRHHSFNILSRLYLSLLDKLTRSSYISSSHRSYYVFDLINFDI
jgi:hypothetical protein